MTAAAFPDISHTRSAPSLFVSAITRARTGAEKLWAGTVTIHPNGKTGAHHHGDLESVIYIITGRARMRCAYRAAQADLRLLTRLLDSDMTAETARAASLAAALSVAAE